MERSSPYRRVCCGHVPNAPAHPVGGRCAHNAMNLIGVIATEDAAAADNNAAVGEAAAAAAAAPSNTHDLTNSADDDEELEPLTDVWQDEFIKLLDNGKKMNCLWCGKTFTRHATRCLTHVLKISGCGIGICTAIIPKNHCKRHSALCNSGQEKSDARERGHERTVGVREMVGVLLVSVLKMASMMKLFIPTLWWKWLLILRRLEVHSSFVESQMGVRKRRRSQCEISMLFGGLAISFNIC